MSGVHQYATERVADAVSSNPTLAAREAPARSRRPERSGDVGGAAAHQFGSISVVAIDQTGGGAPAAPPPPLSAPAALPVTVDRIDIVDSPSGAISGFTGITTGDLNVPGPWNSTTTGGVSNVHQIHFHVDTGTSSMLTPRREIQRSAWFAGVESQNPPTQVLPPGVAGPPAPGGFDGVLVGPDGPGAHEIKRPMTDTIVAADAPGAASLSAADYPFVYRSHFSVTVANSAGVDVARASYDVRIEKKNAADVPNTENKITPVDKVDLIRGQSLR
jgi:hypothetical protein